MFESYNENCLNLVALCDDHYLMATCIVTCINNAIKMLIIIINGYFVNAIKVSTIILI